MKKLIGSNGGADHFKRASHLCRARDNRVFVHANGREEAFDQVVFATHSDQALAALTDASSEERAILSAVRYLPNQVYLHCDDRLMPKRRNVWSAWNYLTDGQLAQDGTMTVSYWMNLLQNLTMINRFL